MTRSVSQLGAIGLALAAYTFWVLADTSLKLAGASRLSAFEIQAIIGATEVVLLLGFAVVRGNVARLWPRALHKHVLRSCLDVGNNLCVVVALRHIPLVLFYILVFFAPMVTVLLAAAFLDEPLDLRRGFAVLAGFGGVVLAVHPSRTGWHPGYAAGYLACLACVLCFSTNVVWSRVLAQAETPESMIFISGLVTFILCAALAIRHAVPVSALLAGTLTAAGLFSVIGSLCFFLALRHTDAANVVQYHYSQLVTGAALAFAIWRERPTAFMWAGAVLICAAGYYTASFSKTTAVLAQKPLREPAAS